MYLGRRGVRCLHMRFVWFNTRLLEENGSCWIGQSEEGVADAAL